MHSLSETHRILESFYGPTAASMECQSILSHDVKHRLDWYALSPPQAAQDPSRLSWSLLIWSCGWLRGRSRAPPRLACRVAMAVIYLPRNRCQDVLVLSVLHMQLAGHPRVRSCTWHSASSRSYSRYVCSKSHQYIHTSDSSLLHINNI